MLAPLVILGIAFGLTVLELFITTRWYGATTSREYGRMKTWRNLDVQTGMTLISRLLVNSIGWAFGLHWLVSTLTFRVCDDAAAGAGSGAFYAAEHMVTALTGPGGAVDRCCVQTFPDPYSDYRVIGSAALIGTYLYEALGGMTFPKAAGMAHHMACSVGLLAILGGAPCGAVLVLLGLVCCNHWPSHVLLYLEWRCPDGADFHITGHATGPDPRKMHRIQNAAIAQAAGAEAEPDPATAFSRRARRVNSDLSGRNGGANAALPAPLLKPRGAKPLPSALILPNGLAAAGMLTPGTLRDVLVPPTTCHGGRWVLHLNKQLAWRVYGVYFLLTEPLLMGLFFRFLYLQRHVHEECFPTWQYALVVCIVATIFLEHPPMWRFIIRQMLHHKSQTAGRVHPLANHPHMRSPPTRAPSIPAALATPRPPPTPSTSKLSHALPPTPEGHSGARARNRAPLHGDSGSDSDSNADADVTTTAFTAAIANATATAEAVDS